MSNKKQQSQEPNDTDVISGISDRYWLEDVTPDKEYGIIKMEHSELLDGPLQDYIKSKDWKVTNNKGEEVNGIVI